jgi:hypothetical protein
VQSTYIHLEEPQKEQRPAAFCFANGVATKTYPVHKMKTIESIRYRITKVQAVENAAAFFSITMKKFFVFILVLSSMVVAEYYFLTEIFMQRRFSVIAISLAVILLALLILVRFFKRSFVSS